MNKLSTISYPPPTSGKTWNTVNPRPLHPLREPPAHLLVNPPPLPDEARQRLLDPSPLDGFSFSTHVIPAAYPRSTPYVPPSENIKRFVESSDLKKKRVWVQSIAEELKESKRRYHAMGDTAPDEKEGEVLWNVVNRFWPNDLHAKQGSKGITLFLSHANGFSKEVSYPSLCILAVVEWLHLDLGAVPPKTYQTSSE